MSLSLKRLKERFVTTLTEVSDVLGISAADLTRDDYVRISVDIGLGSRLNGEEINLLGGFKLAREMYFTKTLDLNGGPKVLFMDIETAPILGSVWKLWDNNVALNQIESDWYLLSWSAKWQNAPDSEIMYRDQRGKKNMEDDSELLSEMWNLLDEADIVIGHNSVKFDTKKLNARFIMNGFQPPSSYRQIDTLQIAKRKFALTSNKLEYLTNKLCVKHKKLTHAKFSGFSLWKECLADNIDAWEEMRQYNEMDVLSLEELYDKLVAWDSSVNFNVYNQTSVNNCKCGSSEFKHSGFHYSNTGKFQKYKCISCGAETRSKANLLSKVKRVSLRTGV